MKLDISYDRSIAEDLRTDSELRRGVEHIGAMLSAKAAQLPDYVVPELKAEWFRPMIAGIPDPLIVGLRIAAGDEHAEDTFTDAGVRNPHPGEPDARFWIFSLWDSFLSKLLRRSLNRIRQHLSVAAGGD